MIGASHIAAGATVGIALQDPWLAFPVAFATHYLLDAIPHHEYLPPEELRSASFTDDIQTLGKGAIDALVGFGAVAILTQLNPVAMGAAFFGVLPDAFNAVGFTLAKGGTMKPTSILGRLFAAQRRFHRFVHIWKRPYAAPLRWALVNQALPVFIILGALEWRVG